MKPSIKVIMCFVMPVISVLFSIAYYYLAMSFVRNDLFLCIMLGAIFGLINYLVILRLFNKFDVLKKSNSVLQDDLRFDKLTGTLNRRAFDNDLEYLQDGRIYSMIFIDVDNFKNFNDQYGHQTGDEVLIKAVKAMQSNLRNSDVIYRYGGEEFVVILRDCEKQNALQIAEKIRIGVESIDTQQYAAISISLGVSSYPEDGPNAAVIIYNSDNALLLAKKRGKNRTHVHTPN